MPFKLPFHKFVNLHKNIKRTKGLPLFVSVFLYQKGRKNAKKGAKIRIFRVKKGHFFSFWHPFYAVFDPFYSKSE